MAYIVTLNKAEKIFTLTKKMSTFSGTVKKSGVGCKREILIMNPKKQTILASGFSDSVDGSFSITAPGGGSDRFLLICLGENSEENSQVFDFILGDE